MSCSPSAFIRFSHLLHNADLFHKQAGAFSGKSGSHACYGQILTGTSSADNIHWRQLCSVQLRDIAHVNHIRKSDLGYLHREGFDFAGPQWRNTVAESRQRKTANAVKQAAKGQLLLSGAHFVTACTTVCVVLTAACAV